MSLIVLCLGLLLGVLTITLTISLFIAIVSPPVHFICSWVWIMDKNSYRINHGVYNFWFGICKTCALIGFRSRGAKLYEDSRVVWYCVDCKDPAMLRGAVGL
jgi:hypothetical protein